ncbi:MAG: hypothetical protein GXX79_18590 [Actinomycetales bacterium]|nr:hypothetical protein [Actinomycetales bacterium]
MSRWLFTRPGVLHSGTGSESVDRLGDGGSGDEGAVAVLVAVLIVVLLGVAALVLDLGLAMDTRGQAQNAADSSALAAAVALAEGESTLVAVSRAESFASRNYGVTAAEWASCTDDHALPVHPVTGCISVEYRDGEHAGGHPGPVGARAARGRTGRGRRPCPGGGRGGLERAGGVLGAVRVLRAGGLPRSGRTPERGRRERGGERGHDLQQRQWDRRCCRRDHRLRGHLEPQRVVQPGTGGAGGVHRPVRLPGAAAAGAEPRGGRDRPQRRVYPWELHQHRRVYLLHPRGLRAGRWLPHHPRRG